VLRQSGYESLSDLLWTESEREMRSRQTKGLPTHRVTEHYIALEQDRALVLSCQRVHKRRNAMLYVKRLLPEHVDDREAGCPCFSEFVSCEYAVNDHHTYLLMQA
jgi:hypothetical protein